MMNLRFTTLPALLAGVLLSFPVGASDAREITWDDLVPEEAQFDDPFTKLTDDQLYELVLVAEVRDRLDAGQTVDEQTLANYHERVEGLEDEGVDIDGLIAMRDTVAEERIAKTYIPNKALDGKSIRMPGYLLPLEFDGDKVTEFFLVPYVGACIHTPPPPPNQIVHVKIDEGYIVDGGLYTPVWVDGLLNAEQRESNLNYVDGAANIPSSYALEATAIEPYE